MTLKETMVFLKAIYHECQRSCKFEYLYSSFVYGMSDDSVYCTDRAMQRNKGPSFFRKQGIKVLP